MDLDDIWDQPIAPSPPRTAHSEHATPARSSPAKRRRTTLFLSSDSERDDAPNDKPTYRARTPAKKVPKDIEALFDDLDDDDGLGELAPALDLDQLRKQADARHAKHIPHTPHQVLPSSSPPRDIDDEDGAGGKKDKDDEGLRGNRKRKPIARLDEARLLGRDGFPALVKQTKHFKPRGKGHEVSDLSRLLQVYQFWSHKMYPKTPFNDSVQRIEKLCHSKRMHNALGVWRDEEKGLIHGQKPEDLQSQDENDSDSNDSNESGKEDNPQRLERAQSSDAEGGSQREPLSTASSPPPRPPSSASEFTGPEDDFDIDAMLREEEEARMGSTSQPKPPTSSTLPPPPQPKPQPPVPMDEDEDQAMWDELHVFEEPAPEPRKTAPAVQLTASSGGGGGGADEDEDMWDLVRELEQEQVQPPPPPPAPAPAPATTLEQSQTTASGDVTSATSAGSPEQPESQGGVQATNDEGWDEMYL